LRVEGCLEQIAAFRVLGRVRVLCEMGRVSMAPRVDRNEKVISGGASSISNGPEAPIETTA
jgi:hypothetical protein